MSTATAVYSGGDLFGVGTGGAGKDALSLEKKKRLILDDLRTTSRAEAIPAGKALSTRLAASSTNAKRTEQLLAYLDGLRDEAARSSAFSKAALDNAWQAWDTLLRIFEQKHLDLSVPDACPGENDNILLSWNADDFYAECEVFGDGRLEFFFRDKGDERFDTSDATLSSPLPEEALAWLTRFAL